MNLRYFLFFLNSTGRIFRGKISNNCISCIIACDEFLTTLLKQSCKYMLLLCSDNALVQLLPAILLQTPASTDRIMGLGSY